MASDDQEIINLRTQAAERERVQEERIKKLEQLVMQKLQSLLAFSAVATATGSSC